MVKVPRWRWIALVLTVALQPLADMFHAIASDRFSDSSLLLGLFSLVVGSAFFMVVISALFVPAIYEASKAPLRNTDYHETGLVCLTILAAHIAAAARLWSDGSAWTLMAYPVLAVAATLAVWAQRTRTVERIFERTITIQLH